MKGWKLEEFVATMRTGVDPNGHELSKEMPWQPIGRMSDEELSAVYEYLTHSPIPETPLLNEDRTLQLTAKRSGSGALRELQM